MADTFLIVDRKTFFAEVKQSLFAGKMSIAQVVGVTAILDEWEARRNLTDVRWLAYIFATCFHETAATMQPIKEYVPKGYAKNPAEYYRLMYDITGNRKKVAMDLGNTQPGDGAKYCGRGHTQNTGRANYTKLTKANVKGWDFVNNPDLLLAMQPSIWATFHSMINGLYTGKKLADYFNEQSDWVGARRIVNRLDKAELIAGYAQQFYGALK